MKKNRALSIITAITLVVSTGTFSFVNAVSVPEVSVTPEEKITGDLYEVMNSADESDLIPVGVRLKDLDASKIDRMVEQRSDFKVCDYADMNIYTERIVPEIVREAEQEYGLEAAHVMPIVDPETDTVTYTADIYYDESSVSGRMLSDMKFSDRVKHILSKVSEADKNRLTKENFGMSKVTKAISEDIDEYMSVRRECVTEAYKRYNYRLVSDYITDEQIITNIGFAPYIIINARENQILNLAENKNVEKISYSPELKPQATLDNASDIVNVTDSGYSYTGAGVKVGILEAGCGKYDPEYIMLSGCSNLHYVYMGNTDPGVIDDHATLVTSIIKGKSVTYNGHTYVGVAPDATVYQSCYNSSYTLYQNLEYLAQQGASIINCSFGYDFEIPYYYKNPLYNDEDWLMDQAINNYCFVGVVSAGNSGTYVNSPGKAYDAVTVGNCDTTGTPEYPMSSSSGYIESDGLTNKPDIAAPGKSVTLPQLGTYSGTSVSAPIVSGIAAQMIQCMPTLKMPTQSQNQYGGKTYFNTIKAFLLLGANYQIISSCNNASKMTGSNSDLFRDKSGAGLVDAEKTLKILNGNGYFRSFKNIDMSSNGTSPSGMNSYSTYEEGEQLRAVLCFSKIHQGTNDINNLDLTLRDSTNTQIVYSASLYNNVEIIEYQFIAYGNYLLSAEANTPIYVNNNETLPGALVYYSIIPD
jgi:hypothetical protein